MLSSLAIYGTGGLHLEAIGCSVQFVFASVCQALAIRCILTKLPAAFVHLLGANSGC